MKGTMKKKKRTDTKYEQKLKKQMPSAFNVLRIIVKQKKIIVDMKELMEIVNTENKMEIVSAMNKAATFYFYFGRLTANLEDEVNDVEEDFNIWMAKKKSHYQDEKSEEGKKRQVISNYMNTYKEKMRHISQIKKYLKFSEIAKKAIDKNINLIQSIGAMVRESSKRNPESDMGFEPDE